MSYDEHIECDAHAGELEVKIEQLQAELKLYRKGFCEAHQALPEDTYEGCYCCDLVQLEVENIKLKRSNNIHELQARDRRQQIRQLQAENEKLTGIVLLFDNYCRVNDIDMEQFLNQSNNQSNDSSTGHTQSSEAK